LILSANSESEIKESPKDEVTVFLNVIKQAKILNDKIKIIVVNINGRKTTNHFIKDLTKTLQNEEWKELAAFIIPLDVSSGLTKEKYHVLDDHMNAKGHAFVASKLKELINNF